MDELDQYGYFNTRYEGAGELVYIPGENVRVYFEVRQLFTGQLLVACVSSGAPIKSEPVSLEGHLLSGEPFSTMWGKRLTEIYRRDGKVHQVHYFAKTTRVRYTKDLQPRNQSVGFALHNLLPGRHSDVSADRITVTAIAQGRQCTIHLEPVGNYRDQSERLLRHGGNLRTMWARTELATTSEEPLRVVSAEECLSDMLAPLCLATGSRVTMPQMITFAGDGQRNDVEHYAEPSVPYSDFVRAKAWDVSVQEAVQAWYSSPPRLLNVSDLRSSIFQHLDACSTEVHVETRALVAATLLDVLAGRYTNTHVGRAGKHPTFKDKLRLLLGHLGMGLSEATLTRVVKARNSLVHASSFIAADQEKIQAEYQSLLLLGRSALVRLIGLRSDLHEHMTL